MKAAVASGVGVALLAEGTVGADHRRLGPEEGFPDPPSSELAPIANKPRPAKPVAALAVFLTEVVGTVAR